MTPGTRQPMCGGTVINSHYILTAAHCFWFAKMTPDQIEVLVHAQLLDATVTRADASADIKLGQANLFNIQMKSIQTKFKNSTKGVS